MDVTIVSDKKLQMTKRREVVATIGFSTQTTPSRTDVKAELVKKLGVNADVTFVHTILSGFGRNVAKVTAYVYDSAEAVKQFEAAYMVKKHAPKVAAEGAQ